MKCVRALLERVCNTGQQLLHAVAHYTPVSYGSDRRPRYLITPAPRDWMLDGTARQWIARCGAGQTERLGKGAGEAWI